MKVAIMGAGLSGLCCAITLERNGIDPVVFENRSQVGDRFVNGEVMLSILNRPVHDCLAYLSQEHGIYLQPVGNIKKLVLHSENEKAEVNGHLGFSNLRGRDADSFENQLARQYKGKLVLNSTSSYEELLEEFTHVIVATGDAAYTDKIQHYQKDLTVTLKGATVEGKFDRYTAAAWLDNRFAPGGYGYFIPISEEEANIVIAYPDYPENRSGNLEEMWDMFYERARMDLDQELKITDKFEVTRYIIGICKYPRIGNTLFVGNCYGSIMPFMGFGQFLAMMTGIYAAHDLCGEGRYEDLVKGFYKSYNNSLVLRRAMEKMDNAKQDFLVKSLNNGLTDRIFDVKRIDVLKLVSYLLRPVVIGSKRKV